MKLAHQGTTKPSSYSLKHAGLVLLADDILKILIEKGETVKIVSHLLGLFSCFLSVLGGERLPGAHLEDYRVPLGYEGLNLFFLKQVHKV